MESWFHLSERGTNVGTEIRAGVTTFLVMVYIIAVNPAIIAGPLGLDPVAVAAGTALVAGLMTLLMGLATNYPFALAAGLGLNAVVAFSLPALGMTPAAGHGRDRHRGPRHHAARRGWPARGDDERRSAGPEARDRGGDRALHPVHRILGRRDDRGGDARVRTATATAGLRVPELDPAMGLPGRSSDHRGPLGPEDPGCSDPEHHPHHRRRLHHRRGDAARELHHHAQLQHHRARPSGPRRHLLDSDRRAGGVAGHLHDHAQ